MAEDNRDYRRVLFTGDHSQLVVMSLEPGEEIGEKIHAVDQIIYCVKGEGEALVEHQAGEFEKGVAILIPAGVSHNIRNTGEEPLKVFTVYAPPAHPAGTRQASKPEVVALR
jgi:mannose-6-phosphate isomerase-like protein (cupin superfamily)